MYKPVILLILDGWGVNLNSQGNAIAQANTPNTNLLWRHYPAMAVQASSIAVGLPWGEMGNSEVGHTILGAGKIVYQNFPRITLSIQNQTFFSNPAFLNAINHARNYNSKIHLVGLVSGGGVHSHFEHLNALLEMMKNNNASKVYVHAITDGRDTQPNAGLGLIEGLERTLHELNLGRVATIAGRYWGMDRNGNWDRIQKAYECMIGNGDAVAKDVIKFIKESYEKNVTDEFVLPTFISPDDTKEGAIGDNDAVIFFNFREDRARQLTQAFTLPNFEGFQRSKVLQNLYFVTMTEYEKGLGNEVAFAPERISHPLARAVSDAGIQQLHVAETEKYAHVTYFFNGGNEAPYPGEERALIPSLAVANFAKRPEMSAEKITAKIIQEISRGVYGLIVANIANADMVGHTGDFQATIKSIEIVDECVGQLMKAVETYGGALLITADHGNAEEKLNPLNGEVLTEHTNNPVPLWLFTPDNKRNKNQAEIVSDQSSVKGFLADIAPTVLALMEIPKPAEMTGQSLLPILNEKATE